MVKKAWNSTLMPQVGTVRQAVETIAEGENPGGQEEGWNHLLSKINDVQRLSDRWQGVTLPRPCPLKEAST
jgi:hypothetical protein